jgi:polysaccharide export outer membrane protein
VRINDLLKHGDSKANVMLLAPGDVIIIPESMF